MAEIFFKKKRPEDIDELIKILDDHQDAATMRAMADASRIEEWRPSLREISVKYNLLSLLQSSKGHDENLARQILRLTGNLCIDDLPSKSNASKYLSDISKCLDTSNFDVAAGAITNIFTDNPDAPTELAAQLEIPDRFAEGLVKHQLLDTESPISEAIVYFLVDIIQTFYKDRTDDFSPGFIHAVLIMPTLDWDDELHDEILAAVIILLNNNSVQAQIAKSHSTLVSAREVSEDEDDEFGTTSPLMAFIALYQSEAARLPQITPNKISETSEDEAATVQSLHALQNAAGDIASSLAYRNVKQMKRDPVIRYFQDSTRENHLLHRILASSLAFLCLGNIARTAQTCIDLVQNFDFHEHAISLIASIGKRNPEARYLAVGFLCNIANAAEEHKAMIYNSEIIHQLMLPTWPEGLNDGLRLLRAVVRKSPQHCRLLLSAPTGSPGFSVSMSDLEAWLSTMTPSNTIEVARLIVTLLRTLQLENSDLTPDTFMTQNFAECFLVLTEQGTRSPLASEGLLGFGLALGSPVSARLVANTLSGGDLKRFLKAVEGDTTKENIENALVVLSKLHEEEAKTATKELMARISK